MIFIFLPAYNEEVALERVVRKFDEEFKRIGEAYRVLVLDDGSQDRTAEVAIALAAQYPIQLLQHSRNEGLGQTMVDGLQAVAKAASPDDVIVTLDCDDTHDPQYVHAALAKIREGYDLVILSRYQKGGGETGLSFFRKFLSRGAGLFLKLFFPISGVQEYSCGYRAFRASALQNALELYGKKFVQLAHMGFVVTPEILIKFRMMGCRIAEVPFVLKYDQKPTKSKNKPIKTILGYGALLGLYWGRKAPNRYARSA